MRLSRYFLPVLKENPAEAQIVSHRLMLRAGMIKQSAAGIYSWLPLGLKVLKNNIRVLKMFFYLLVVLLNVNITLQREGQRFNSAGAKWLDGATWSSAADRWSGFLLVVLIVGYTVVVVYYCATEVPVLKKMTLSRARESMQRQRELQVELSVNTKFTNGLPKICVSCLSCFR